MRVCHTMLDNESQKKTCNDIAEKAEKEMGAHADR